MEMPGEGLQKNKAQCLTLLVERAGVRLAEVSESVLGPGVSSGYRMGQICIKSKGLEWGTLGWADPSFMALISKEQEYAQLSVFIGREIQSPWLY